MSQYFPPPSFDGQHNYAPPWPVQLPHVAGTPNQHGANMYAMGNHQMGIGSFAPLPFGATTPTQLPGLGLPTTAVPSPNLPQQFGSDQVSMPPYVGFHTSLGVPADSAYLTRQIAYTQPSERVESRTKPQTSNLSKNPPPSSEDDTDREEGEVSDGSGYDLSHQHIGSRSKISASLPIHQERSIPGGRAAFATDKGSLESQPFAISTPEGNGCNGTKKGLAESDMSPYIPPVAASTSSMAPDKFHQPDTLQVQKSISSEKQGGDVSRSSRKSPAQMRVMAQGALLKLAPHNIRFSELVKEDINPAILKQLYDDIGIKVTSIATKTPGKVIPESGTTERKTARYIDNTNTATTESQERLPGKAVSSTIANTTTNETSSDASSKPLERKDVIARMLAEKAKKKVISTVVESVGSSNTVPSTENDTPISRPKSENALPMQPKEKNRAQTELARQRMEQLKKMGLKRQQSNIESLNVPGVSSLSPLEVQNMTSVAKPDMVNTLHHPLPERPPITKSPSKASIAKIPGLSLSSEPIQNGSPPAIDNRILNNSTPFKNSLGKRPRASDFDEPIPETKKPTIIEERLVIDISEDEVSDVDEDVMMSEASDSAMDSLLSKSHGNRQPATVSRNAYSASVTPQSRASELESLRQKNLEIQAMRRRIAEWEEKNAKKAKFPHSSATVVNTVTSPLAATDAQIEQAESEFNNELADSTSAPLQDSASQSLPRSPSAQSLASMDSSDMTRLRQKLLRKRDIESGLPALDAELLKFEAKLAEFKREEERLLSEIARSREERKKLTDELESLGVETEGLTFDEMKAAKEDIEKAAAVQAEHRAPDVVTAESTPLYEHLQPTVKAATTHSMDRSPSLERKSPLHEPTLSHEVSDSVEVEDSGSSESFGTSMDESTSSSGSSSMDEESESESGSESEPQAAALPASGGDGHTTHETLLNDDPTTEPPEATAINLAETEPHTITTPAAEQSDSLFASREPSVQSDNYEPPEPEESSDEAYSPKLGPSGIEDTKIEAAPNFSIQSDADMMLTLKSQNPVVIATKGDALDNPPDGGNTISKFSPYQSPLKYFRSYRYHPNFVENVKDSYRSLTYSHKIDSSQAICPYEAAGGVCNDATCEFQHWRDMVMPDDKILVEMGNQREGKTPEEREAYIEGLKGIINNMRRDQVKDFFTVAGEIAAYRRRFLSDPSRILPL